MVEPSRSIVRPDGGAVNVTAEGRVKSALNAAEEGRQKDMRGRKKAPNPGGGEVNVLHLGCGGGHARKGKEKKKKRKKGGGKRRCRQRVTTSGVNMQTYAEVRQQQLQQQQQQQRRQQASAGSVAGSQGQQTCQDAWTAGCGEEQLRRLQPRRCNPGGNG